MLKFIHYIILFFLLTAPLGALAQDWALFPEGQKGYYKGKFGKNMEGAAELGLIVADSVEQSGDTTIYRLNFNRPIYGANCKTSSLRNDFLNEELREEEFVRNSFFRISVDFQPVKVIADTCCIGDFKIARLALAGDSWLAANGIICRVDSIVWTDLGRVQDSVKYISRETADTTTQFLLSKNWGLVRFRPEELNLLLENDREIFGGWRGYELIGGEKDAQQWGFQMLDFKEFFEHRRPGNVFYYEVYNSWSFTGGPKYDYFKDSVTAKTETEDAITITFDRTWRKKVFLGPRGVVDTIYKEIGHKRSYGHFFRIAEPGQFLYLKDEQSAESLPFPLNTVGIVALDSLHLEDDSVSYELSVLFEGALSYDHENCRWLEKWTDGINHTFRFRPGFGVVKTTFSTVSSAGSESLVGYNIDGEQTGEEWHVSRAEKTAARPSFRLFPNPANDRLNVVFDQPATSPATYAVRDLTGRTLFSGELAGETLDVAELPSGAYLLEVRRGAERATEKFIIAK